MYVLNVESYMIDGPDTVTNTYGPFKEYKEAAVYRKLLEAQDESKLILGTEITTLYSVNDDQTIVYNVKCEHLTKWDLKSEVFGPFLSIKDANKLATFLTKAKYDTEIVHIENKDVAKC